MKYLGDYAASSTLYFTFSTHKADGTPITLAGTPSLAVYKADGTSQSTTGITLAVDFDSVTGLHSVKIECTDAFYTVGNDYSVVIAAGTVDSVSVVGYTIATFSIENRNTKADVIAISGDTTAADNAELMFDGTGYAGGTTKLQTAVASIATDAITAASVNADAVTKIQAGLSTHSAADVKTAIEAAGSSIASILADTAELQTDWVNGGRLNLLIDAIKAKTDTYTAAPTTAEIKTALEIAGGTLALILADVGELQTDWVNGGRLDALIDAIKAKTDTIPTTPAAVGSAMTLADDAITAAKFDESTAFPIKSADTGATQIARTGADADTLETLSDEIAGVSGGTPLTAQEVRDAMKLAPSAGVAAADSIDGDLDDIQTRLPAALVDGKMDSSATVALSAEDIGDISDAVIAWLGGATVTITSPVSQSNDVTILRDTDYTTEIVWTYTYSGSLTGYTAALHCRGAGITSHTVTIGGIAGAYTLTAAFTNAETAALDTCIDDYSITFTKTADNTVLPHGVEGVMIVRDWGGV